MPVECVGAIAWSWRLLLVAGAVTALLVLLRHSSLVTLLTAVTVPCGIAWIAAAQTVAGPS